MLAALGHDAIEEVAARARERRSVKEQKAGQRHGQEEFERSDPRVARESQHGSGQRLQMGSHLAQGRAKVAGCLSPEVVQFGVDERPVPDALRRGWNRQAASAKVFGEISYPV